MVLSQTNNGTTHYLLPDAQNSTRAVTNAAGTITSNYDYDAFGNLLGEPTLETNYLYTGQQFDVISELYSLRARYYDASIGRFLSRDTWAYDYQNPVELNRYVYTANNPATLYDPTGNMSLVARIGIGGGVLLSTLLLIDAYQQALNSHSNDYIMQWDLGEAFNRLVEALLIKPFEFNQKLPETTATTLTAMAVAATAVGGLMSGSSTGALEIPGVGDLELPGGVCGDGKCVSTVDAILRALFDAVVAGTLADIGLNTIVTIWVDGGNLPVLIPFDRNIPRPNYSSDPHLTMYYNGKAIANAGVTVKSYANPLTGKTETYYDALAAVHAYISFKAHNSPEIAFDNFNTVTGNGINRRQYQNNLSGVAWRNCYSFRLATIISGIPALQLRHMVSQAEDRQIRMLSPTDNKLTNSGACNGASIVPTFLYP